MLEFVGVFGQNKVICNVEGLVNNSTLQRVKLAFTNIQ
jgi:hypothetical protein